MTPDFFVSKTTLLLCHAQQAYSDVLITKNNGKLDATVFQKSTNTGLYTKWASLCPLKYKKIWSNISCFILIKFATRGKLYNKEFQTIPKLLLKNGYPLHFIDLQIRKFLNLKHTNCEKDLTPNQKLNRFDHSFHTYPSLEVIESPWKSFFTPSSHAAFYCRQRGIVVRSVVFTTTMIARLMVHLPT